MADLISLEEFYAAIGTAVGDQDPTTDAKYEAAIAQASAAIQRYAERDFASESDDGDRSFEYDGSGLLEIDDATEVTAVVINFTGFTQTVTTDQCRVEPFGGPIYTYIVMPRVGRTMSPEMGFAFNLDVAYREGRIFELPVSVTVTGTWGWPDVPDDVKRAAIWTTMAFSEDPQEYQARAIAGYSESRGMFAPQEAIPSRAKDLLAPYMRVKV